MTTNVRLLDAAIDIFIDGDLKSSIAYGGINSIRPIVKKAYDISQTPPAQLPLSEQWYVRLVLANGNHEDFRLGNLASEPTWTNNEAGYENAKTAIDAAMAA